MGRAGPALLLKAIPNSDAAEEAAFRGGLEVAAAEGVDSNIGEIAFVEQVVDTDVGLDRPVAVAVGVASLKVTDRIGFDFFAVGVVGVEAADQSGAPAGEKSARVCVVESKGGQVLGDAGNALVGEVLPAGLEVTVSKVRPGVVDAEAPTSSELGGEGCLDALVPTLPGVAVELPSGRYCQLEGSERIVDVDIESGQLITNRAARQRALALQADLVVPGGLGFESGVEAAAAWVVELGGGGGFESLGEVGVEGDGIAGRPAQPRHGAPLGEADVTAVVAVGQKVIAHVEADLVVAQSGREFQILVEGVGL